MIIKSLSCYNIIGAGAEFAIARAHPVPGPSYCKWAFPFDDKAHLVWRASPFARVEIGLPRVHTGGEGAGPPD